MPFSRYHGTLRPTDLELLQRVFDQSCKERRLAKKDKEQREELAADIVRAFNRGAADEAVLLRNFSRRHRSG